VWHEKWARKASWASSRSPPGSRPGRILPGQSTRWEQPDLPRYINIAEVTTAVADGSLSKKITIDNPKARFWELKNTVNRSGSS